MVSRELPPHARLRQPHLQPHQRGRGERNWVKFHWVCQQGIKTLTDKRPKRWSARIGRATSATSTRPSRTRTIPKWKLCIQVMPEKDALTYKFHPFDLTKVWLHGDYPLMDVGVMELNKNPENYFADVEQAAFNPAQRGARHRLLAGQDAAGPPLLLRRCAAVPPGREPSPDPGEQGPLPGARLQP